MFVLLMNTAANATDSLCEAIALRPTKKTADYSPLQAGDVTGSSNTAATAAALMPPLNIAKVRTMLSPGP